MARPAPIPRGHITGLVLAGGRGSRMGGIDKGLQTFHGAPLALRALQRLAPQVGATAVSANRNLPAYEAFGAPVWPDGIADHAGPLAGVLAGMERCAAPWLLTVPCDTPLFPHDLASRLAAALVEADAEIAMASAPASADDGDAAVMLRPQPVFCLLPVALHDSLARFLQGGGRKVGAWAAQHRTVRVPFDRETDAPDAFFNANTLAELQTLEGARGR